jgi:integrase
MTTLNRKSIQEQIDRAAADPNKKLLKFYRLDEASFLLQVTPSGVKSWCYRYTLNGKTRLMGLGPVHRISFDEAGKRARKVRVLLDDRIDPLAERDRLRAEQAVEQAKSKTFRVCAAEFIQDHRAGWKSEKHAAQWPATLETYAYPTLGDIPVSEITVTHVRKVIEPIWHTKNETAERVRSRLEKVLGWATVHGYRSGDNPARWSGYLSEIFPKRAAVRKIKHHPALPYADLPEFMRILERLPGIGSYVLRFLILTATRTTEARAAEWSEVDMKERLWCIPALRMKASRPHRVPLSEPAINILRCMKTINDAHPMPSRYVFNGQKWGQHPSEAIMLSLLKRIDRTEIVPHGFRSTFRVFVAEQTRFPREIAEAALAHALQDKTEAAYQRGDYIAKRVEMMNVWANFCMSTNISPESAAG